MIKGSISSIESFSTVDGPGIRTVIFFNDCNLRCIYCHNPEMWNKQENNTTVNSLVDKILKNKEYFASTGGVTFSGGEPLLHTEYLIKVCKKLKKHNIHIAIETSGAVNSNYNELLKYLDLIILDLKHVTDEGYQKITGLKTNYTPNLIEAINKNNKKVWIRQVIIPGITDKESYIKELSHYIKNNIKNIEKIEFLPYHKLGSEKYIKLGIPYRCKDIPEMDKKDCEKLYKKFMNIYKSEL